MEIEAGQAVPPHYFLTSARLGFRAWTASDLPLARALWGDPRVTALIGGPFSDDAVRARLDRELASPVQYWPRVSVER